MQDRTRITPLTDRPPPRSHVAAFADFMFGHEGRIGRMYYWLGLLATAAITGFFAGIADGVVPALDVTRYGAVAFIIGALIWMHSAVTVKRLHDRNRPGIWYFLYGLAPPGLMLWAMLLHADNQLDTASLMYVLSILGFTGVFVDLGVMRGTVGPNRFGPDPASTTAAKAEFSNQRE
jgi:uncharacterized membrane protein YhaH (DUF805 family)